MTANLQMLPSPPVKYIEDRYLVNPKVFREVLHRHNIRVIKASDFRHVFFSQFGINAFLSDWLSSFCLHVFEVVGLCAKPKVFGVYARSVVTSVTYAKAAWNRTFVQFIRKTMRANRKVFFSCSDTERSVSTFSESSFPFPAPSLLFSVIPEALLWVFRFPVAHISVPRLGVTRFIATVATLIGILPSLPAPSSSGGYVLSTNSAWFIQRGLNHA